MSNFDLNSYEPVEARLQKYLKQYPDARVITKVEHQDEQRILIKTYLYKNIEELEKKLPHATGLAEETRGEGYVNKTSHVENCETSSLGRALANAGFSGNKNGQRASREEMKKVASSEPAADKPAEGFEISDNQIKMIYALTKTLGWTAEQAKAHIKTVFKVESLKDLTKRQASLYIDKLKEKESQKMQEMAQDAGLTDQEMDEI